MRRLSCDAHVEWGERDWLRATERPASAVRRVSAVSPRLGFWQEKGLLCTVFRTSPRVRRRLAVPDVHAERVSCARRSDAERPQRAVLARGGCQVRV